MAYVRCLPTCWGILEVMSKLGFFSLGLLFRPLLWAKLVISEYTVLSPHAARPHPPFLNPGGRYAALFPPTGHIHPQLSDWPSSHRRPPPPRPQPSAYQSPSQLAEPCPCFPPKMESYLRSYGLCLFLYLYYQANRLVHNKCSDFLWPRD